MTAQYRIEVLAESHDRAAFSCGVDALDRYLKTQAGQDVRRRIANCFVAVSAGSAQVAGFYTLAAASIPLTALTPDQVRKLPKYPVLPAALLGRLAVDTRHAGESLERNPEKWKPVFRQIARQSKNPEPHSDLNKMNAALGAALLFDALQRAANAAPAVFALLVDAKDDGAARFYRHHGFLPFVSRERSFFLPVGTALRR